MSIFRNLLGTFVPVRERREASGTLAAANAELVLDTNGDESALIYVNAGAATFNATLEFTGSVDGTNFFPIIAFPYSPGCVGGTVPVAGQPLLVEAVNTAGVIRAYALACGQLKKVRVRLAAWASGSAATIIVSDTQGSLNANVAIQRSGTQLVTNTGGVGAAVTATLPAVTGLRHYIDFIRVTRSATAALTAAAAPVLVTTGNLPGSPVITFGADAAGIGLDKEGVLDFGAAGMAAITAGGATSVVCPAYPGVVWRVNVCYRLGL